MVGYNGNGIKSIVRELPSRSDLRLQANPDGSGIVYFGIEHELKPPIPDTQLFSVYEITVPEGVRLAGERSRVYGLVCDHGKYPNIRGQLVRGDKSIPVSCMVQKEEI